MKVKVNVPLDYIRGHLRYGHEEGIVNIPETDIEKFKENPFEYMKEKEDMLWDLDIVVDEYEVEDFDYCGKNTTWEEVE